VGRDIKLTKTTNCQAQHGSGGLSRHVDPPDTDKAVRR